MIAATMLFLRHERGIHAVRVRHRGAAETIRPVDPQLAGAAEADVGREGEVRSSRQAESGGLGGQELEHDPDFHPGQRRAEAVVDALSEGKMGARVAAVDVERLGFTELARVAAGRAEQQQDLGARGYLHLADRRRAGGDPAPGDHAGVVPQDFLDGGGDGVRGGARD